MPLLRLVIENVSNLPDGGPVSFEVRGSRGIDIGRDQHLDWTLPDTERFVSGKHCEIRFRQGGYWLHDVSSNGTFINGSDKRPSEPYRLRNGDRLEIGPYNVAVTVEEDQVEDEPVETPVTPAREAADSLWDIHEEAAAPVPTGMIRPPGDDRKREPDFLDWRAELPQVDPAPAPTPAPDKTSDSPTARDPWRLTTFDPQPGGSDPDRPRDFEGEPAVNQPFVPQPEFPPSAPAPAVDQAASQAPMAEPKPVDSAGAEPAAEAGPPDVMPARPDDESGAVPPAPADAEGRATQADLAAFLRVFGQETGVPTTMFDGQAPEELARRIGRFMRISVEGLQQLLRARAQSRGLVRSGGQTMVQSAENNPLKFLPGPEDVLRVLMGPPVNSFLDAETTLDRSFEDLSSHQVATYAAMQQALQSLLDDLEPSAIEQSVEAESGLERIMSRRKARLWDRYAERWKARTEKHDNGMTDEFMLRFGEAYERNTRKLR